jgi:adiponectin receptor
MSSPTEDTTLLQPGTPESTKLLTYEESLRLLPWQTDNEYVLSGYRTQLESIKACLWSSVACESALAIKRTRLT